MTRGKGGGVAADAGGTERHGRSIDEAKGEGRKSAALMTNKSHEAGRLA